MQDLNDAGQVAFFGHLSGIGGTGQNIRLYRSDAPARFTLLHHYGQAAPDGNGTFVFAPYRIDLNASGQASFTSTITGGTPRAGDYDAGVYRTDGGTPVQIARARQPVAGGAALFGFEFNAPLNDAGQVAFLNSAGIFRGDGGPLVPIARNGQAAPDGLGTIHPLGGPAINAVGQVAFRGGGPGDWRTDSIWRGDGTALTRVARVGLPASDGNGHLSDLGGSTPALNNSGQVAFTGVIMGADGGDVEQYVVYRSDGGALTQIARARQATAFGPFLHFSDPDLNDVGQVALVASFDDGRGLASGAGVFRGDGGTLTALAHSRQATPGGNGTFELFYQPALNAAGQTAFLSTLAGTVGGDADDNGLFLYDDALGLIQVAREGDALLGSTIAELLFHERDPTGAELTGLNNRGQLAYHATLADGRQVIALATDVPEPAALTLLATASLLLRRARQSVRTSPAASPAPLPKPAAVTPGEWPQWRGPGRTNVSPDTGLLTEWPLGGPPLAWCASGLGEGVPSVAVSRGRVYTLGYRQDAEFLTAWNAKAGTKKWEARVGPAVPEQRTMRWLSQRTPTVEGDLVYAVTARGELVCLHTTNGAEQWRKDYADLGGRAGTWGYCDFPLVDGDRLICTPGGKNGAVVALDKHTDALLWKCAIPGVERATYGGIVAAEIAGVRQYVHQFDLGAVGVSTDGRELWRYTGTHTLRNMGNVHTAIVRGDSVFCSVGWGQGCALLKLTCDGGTFSAAERYREEPGKALDPWMGNSSWIGDHVYTNTGYCIDARSGKQAWSAGLGVRITSVVADGHLYYRLGDGTVVLAEVNPGRYVERARFLPPRATKEPAWTSPVIAGGMLYLRDQDVLLCYDLRKERAGPAASDPAANAGDAPPAAPMTPPRPDAAEEGRGTRRARDAIFVPTPQDVVERMLQLAAVTKDDVVYDLGCGDGRIVVTAAKKYGCRATGFDTDPECVRLSRESVAKEKVGELVSIEDKDLFTVDLSRASVVTLYLGREVNRRLLPQFAKLKPGASVVSHNFEIDGWEPDKTARFVSAEDDTEHVLYLWTAPFHAGPGAAILSERSREVSDRTVKTAKVSDWTAESAPEGHVFRATARGTSDVAFSPDGTRLAVVGAAVDVREVATGREVYHAAGGGSRIAFSPDGTRYALSGGGVKLYDSADGRLLRELSSVGSYGLAFSPDGRHVAVASGKGAGWTKVLDVVTEQTVHTLEEENMESVWDVAFSPDGRFVATASGNFADSMTVPGRPGEVKVWDVATGHAVRTLEGLRFVPFCVAFSPDGSTVACGGGMYHARRLRARAHRGAAGEVKVWDVASGREVFTRERPQCVFRLAFSPEGSRLATAGGAIGGDAPADVTLWERAKKSSASKATGAPSTGSPSVARAVASRRRPATARPESGAAPASEGRGRRAERVTRPRPSRRHGRTCPCDDSRTSVKRMDRPRDEMLTYVSGPEASHTQGWRAWFWVAIAYLLLLGVLLAAGVWPMRFSLAFLTRRSEYRQYHPAFILLYTIPPALACLNVLPVVGCALAARGRSPRTAFAVYAVVQASLVALMLAATGYCVWRSPLHSVWVSPGAFVVAAAASLLLSLPLLPLLIRWVRHACIGRRGG